MSRGGNALAGGMGLYPGDPCFQTAIVDTRTAAVTSARPWWVPYWINTPQENACKPRQTPTQWNAAAGEAIGNAYAYSGVTSPGGAAAPGAPPATLQQGPVVLDPAVAATIGPDSAQMAHDASAAAWDTWAAAQDAANVVDASNKNTNWTFLVVAAALVWFMVRR